jgi:hypothetical protein
MVQLVANKVTVNVMIDREDIAAVEKEGEDEGEGEI